MDGDRWQHDLYIESEQTPKDRMEVKVTCNLDVRQDVLSSQGGTPSPDAFFSTKGLGQQPIHHQHHHQHQQQHHHQHQQQHHRQHQQQHHHQHQQQHQPTVCVPVMPGCGGRRTGEVGNYANVQRVPTPKYTDLKPQIYTEGPPFSGPPFNCASFDGPQASFDGPHLCDPFFDGHMHGTSCMARCQCCAPGQDGCHCQGHPAFDGHPSSGPTFDKYCRQDTRQCACPASVGFPGVDVSWCSKQRTRHQYQQRAALGLPALQYPTQRVNSGQCQRFVPQACNCSTVTEEMCYSQPQGCRQDGRYHSPYQNCNRSKRGGVVSCHHCTDSHHADLGPSYTDKQQVGFEANYAVWKMVSGQSVSDDDQLPDLVDADLTKAWHAAYSAPVRAVLAQRPQQLNRHGAQRENIAAVRKSCSSTLPQCEAGWRGVECTPQFGDALGRIVSSESRYAYSESEYCVKAEDCESESNDRKSVRDQSTRNLNEEGTSQPNTARPSLHASGQTVCDNSQFARATSRHVRSGEVSSLQGISQALLGSFEKNADSASTTDLLGECTSAQTDRTDALMVQLPSTVQTSYCHEGTTRKDNHRQPPYWNTSSGTAKHLAEWMKRDTPVQCPASSMSTNKDAETEENSLLLSEKALEDLPFLPLTLETDPLTPESNKNKQDSQKLPQSKTSSDGKPASVGHGNDDIIITTEDGIGFVRHPNSQRQQYIRQPSPKTQQEADGQEESIFPDFDQSFPLLQKSTPAGQQRAPVDWQLTGQCPHKVEGRSAETPLTPTEEFEKEFPTLTESRAQTVSFGRNLNKSLCSPPPPWPRNLRASPFSPSKSSSESPAGTQNIETCRTKTKGFMKPEENPSFCDKKSFKQAVTEDGDIRLSDHHKNSLGLTCSEKKSPTPSEDLSKLQSNQLWPHIIFGVSRQEGCSTCQHCDKRHLPGHTTDPLPAFDQVSAEVPRPPFGYKLHTDSKQGTEKGAEWSGVTVDNTVCDTAGDALTPLNVAELRNTPSLSAIADNLLTSYLQQPRAAPIRPGRFQKNKFLTPFNSRAGLGPDSSSQDHFEGQGCSGDAHSSFEGQTRSCGGSHVTDFGGVRDSLHTPSHQVDTSSETFFDDSYRQGQRMSAYSRIKLNRPIGGRERGRYTPSAAGTEKPAIRASEAWRNYRPPDQTEKEETIAGTQHTVSYVVAARDSRSTETEANSRDCDGYQEGASENRTPGDPTTKTGTCSFFSDHTQESISNSFSSVTEDEDTGVTSEATEYVKVNSVSASVHCVTRVRVAERRAPPCLMQEPDSSDSSAHSLAELRKNVTFSDAPEGPMKQFSNTLADSQAAPRKGILRTRQIYMLPDENSGLRRDTDPSVSEYLHEEENTNEGYGSNDPRSTVKPLTFKQISESILEIPDDDIPHFEDSAIYELSQKENNMKSELDALSADTALTLSDDDDDESGDYLAAFYASQRASSSSGTVASTDTLITTTQESLENKWKPLRRCMRYSYMHKSN